MHQALTERWNAISLRSKITGVTVLLLTFGLLVSGIGTMAMIRPKLVEQLDAQLHNVAEGNLNSYLPQANDLGGIVASHSASSEYFVALFDAYGNLVNRNWTDKPEGELPALPNDVDALEGFALSAKPLLILESNDGRTEFHAVARQVAFRTPLGATGTAIVATSTASVSNVMGTYLAIFLGFGIGVVVLGAMLTRLMVTSTFAPLREVEQTAATIADGDFSQRLPGATPNTEVGRLNRSLNTMLNRIDRAFIDRARTIDQMRRFVGDASHELRTPLVSVRGYAELYRMGALQTPEDVAQAMERIEKEAIRMSGLVEDLLELARLDETRPLVQVPVNLIPIARDAALDAMASAPGRIVTVIAPEHASESAPEPMPESTSEPASQPASARGEVVGASAGSRQQGSGATAVPTRAGAARTATEAPGAATSAAQVATPSGENNKTDKNGQVGTGTGPIALAGATIARLRGRRPKRPVTRPEPISPPPPPPIEPKHLPPAPIVLGEENKLRQVVTNLMANAARFTSVDTPIEIAVSVDEANRRAILEVIDHGEGIPPQIRQKIFQRFWRADTSRTRETGGTGLGLAIVASIVAAHGGVVEADETPGGGATFRVKLPLLAEGASPSAIH